MKWTGVILVCLSIVLAEKERETDQQIDQITDKFIKAIEKRLDVWENDKRDALEDVAEECVFSIKNGSIIRTQDSISAGATFIKAPAVERRAGCQEMCCDIANCNLAVYREKQDDASGNACYLFDCGSPSVCLFTSHPGYIKMEMPKRQTTNKQQEKHEQALADLVTTTTTTTTTTEPTTTTTTTSTTSTTTMTTTTEVKQPVEEEVDIIKELLKYVESFNDPVGLFGECSTHKDCAGSYTECLAGYCVCQEGYHAQDGVCRKDCSRFEFECQNEGQPLNYPQCIAIYDKCDGIIHCKDHSDENNCGGPEDEPVIQKGPTSPSKQAVIPPKPYNTQGQYPPVADQYPQQYEGAFPGQVQSYGMQLQNNFPKNVYPNGQVPNRLQAGPGQQGPSPLANQPQIPPRVPSQGQRPHQTVPQQYPPAQPPQGPNRGPNVNAQYPPAHTIQRKPGIDNIQNNGPPKGQGKAQGGQRNPGAQQPQPVRNGKIVAAQQDKSRPENVKKPIVIDPARNKNKLVAQSSKNNAAKSTPLPKIEIVHRPTPSSKSKVAKPLPTEKVKAKSQNNNRNSYWNFPDGDNSNYLTNYEDLNPNNYGNYLPSHLRNNNFGASSHFGTKFGNQNYPSDGGYVPSSNNRNGGLFQNAGYGNSNGAYGGNRGYYNNIYNPAGGGSNTYGGYGPEYEPYYNDGQNSFPSNGYPANSDYDYYSDNPGKDKPAQDQNKPGKPKPLPSEKVKPTAKQREPEKPKQKPQPVKPKPVKPVPTQPEQPEAEPQPKSSIESIKKDEQPNSSSKEESHDTNVKIPEENTDISSGTNPKPVDDKALPMAPAEDTNSDSKNNGHKDNVVEVQKERITESAAFVSMQKNQGAVIALALGLVITALLLIFVGCRLRNVKRRLRKGRPLNSNEADYLINGMYL